MTEETPASEGEPSPASPEETPTAEHQALHLRRRGRSRLRAKRRHPPHRPRPPPERRRHPGDAGERSGRGRSAHRPVAAAPVAGSGRRDRPARRDLHPEVGRARGRARSSPRSIFGGIGYAIGDSSDSGSSQNASNTLPEQRKRERHRQFPGGGRVPGGGQFPSGTGNSNGNGNGNGNGSNGSGNSNGGGSTASDAGFLGVGVQASTDGKGVEITEVAAGSPAAKAGLQQGDVVTALDGNSVTTPDALRAGRPGQAER